MMNGIGDLSTRLAKSINRVHHRTIPEYPIGH